MTWYVLFRILARLGFALSSTSINGEYMNSKNLMTVMAVVTGLVGLASIILPGQITSMVFRLLVKKQLWLEHGIVKYWEQLY